MFRGPSRSKTLSSGAGVLAGERPHTVGQHHLEDSFRQRQGVRGLKQATGGWAAQEGRSLLKDGEARLPGTAGRHWRDVWFCFVWIKPPHHLKVFQGLRWGAGDDAYSRVARASRELHAEAHDDKDAPFRASPGQDRGHQPGVPRGAQGLV